MAATKKAAQTWRMKDGKEVFLPSMEDDHLVNAIKLVARNGHKTGYLGDIKSDKTMIKLVREAKQRKWKINHLSTPINKNGRNEWVEIIQPIKRSLLSTSMHISDLDSRLEG